MALWERFFGSAGSQAVGVAMGAAAVPALLPYSQDLINAAWSDHQSKPLLASVLADGVARGHVAYDWALNEANQTGIKQERFDNLVQIARAGPGMSDAFDLWRRGVIDEAGFRKALLRLGLEQEWIDDLVKIHDVLLSPAELANARQQGFVDVNRQYAEAAQQGVTSDRAEIQFELAGLPPGPETMQQAVNRGLVDRSTFDQAIREGHTKTKYTDLLFTLRQPILTADEYASLYLKGWITQADMNAGGALHGFTPDQMNLKYLERGRPAAPGQMATAAARGIDGPTGSPVDREQFIQAIKESDIRPEYGPMLWDSRFLYPPLFQITRLVQAGAITAETGAEWAVKDRYPPEVVTPLLKYWSTPQTSTKQTHTDKAQTQLFTATHRSYLTGELSDADAQAALKAAGVPDAEIPAILALWVEETKIRRKQLTAAQIKHAYAKAVTNPATGKAWTEVEALDALEGIGMTPFDAQTYLGG